MKPSVTKLESGLTLIQVPMPSVKSATVLALANTGSRYEKPQQYGIAHFFEHMVFKGTEKYQTAQDLALAVDSIGADFNAFTSKEYTGYYVHAAAKHLELALDVVSDMLLTPQLRQDDIDREKGVIVEEINMYVDSPARHISNLFDQMAFAGSGLEHDILGLKETVTQMTTEHFETFLSQWYGLQNLVLVVAGDATVVDTPDSLQKITTAFGKQSPISRETTTPDRHSILDATAPSPISDQLKRIEHRQTEQSHFLLAWPGLNRHDERRFTLGLLNTILGANMSSRLFSEVREKRGLCYYVNSSVDQYHDAGLFGASAGVDPNRVDEAIKVTIDQFTQIASGQRPITASELAMAKEYIAGKLVLGLEDSESVAQFYGMKQLLMGEIISPTEMLKKYRAVELDEVNALAAELIVPGQMKFGIIGPYDEGRFDEILRS